MGGAGKLAPGGRIARPPARWNFVQQSYQGAELSDPVIKVFRRHAAQHPDHRFGCPVVRCQNINQRAASSISLRTESNCGVINTGRSSGNTAMAWVRLRRITALTVFR